MSDITKNSKRLRAGINKAIICRKCGHKVGTIRLKQRFKWKMFWYAMGIALILELIANTIVYLVFIGL